MPLSLTADRQKLVHSKHSEERQIVFKHNTNTKQSLVLSMMKKPFSSVLALVKRVKTANQQDESGTRSQEVDGCELLAY